MRRMIGQSNTLVQALPILLTVAVCWTSSPLLAAQQAVQRSASDAKVSEMDKTVQSYAQRASRRRNEVAVRQQAMDLAAELANEKAQQRAFQQRDAQRQLLLARERQIKELYYRGLSFYQQGRYKDAVATLQQLTVLDPSHPLVKAAERLITRAELKGYEDRTRVATALPVPAAKSPGPVVSQLEQLLVEKRVELETALKYAKIAASERQYETAGKLLAKVLAQDPSNQQAQNLMEKVQDAKLEEQEHHLERQVAVDEQGMMRDVLKAQVLPPEVQPVRLASPEPTAAAAQMSVKLQQPISLDFSEVALSDVLDFIADAANVSIIPSPQLDLKQQQVSIKIKDLPLEQAIKYLAKSLSLAYRIDQDAILIASQEEFSNEPMETRVLYLQSGLGPSTLEASAVSDSPLLPMESIKKLIEQTVPQPSDSKLVVDERTGSLIITNTADNLKLAEQLLSQLDMTPVQVLIEARLIELTMTDLDHLGLESVLTDSFDLTKERETRPNQAPDTLGPGHTIAKEGGFKFPAMAREGEGLNLTLQGVLTPIQFESLLHVLQETKKSKTLSAPRVTTLNNRTATIKVVDEFRYPTRYEVSLVQFDINGDGDFDDANETEFVNVPQDIQKRDIGILLNVTPSVGKDLKTVTMVLAPEISTFSQFRDLGGGVTVPEFTSSQLTTSVVVDDGQTVVLGGLMKDSITKTMTKVPFFGDLPLVGSLFRQEEDSSTRKNLLIFITAHILAPRGPTT